MGYMYLAAVAKKLKHDCEVFIRGNDENFMKSLIEYSPEVVCFNTATPKYQFTRETACEIKKKIPSCMILVGGWHPTFCPEILEMEDFFDAVCLGEGELPFKIFLESYPDEEKMKTIPNFHIKIDNKVYQNPMLDAIDNLDSIEFPDRSIYYDKYPILRDQHTKIFMIGRGCPYPCTFCFNTMMKNLYKNKGQYVRFRSPENIIEEIKQVKSKYPLKYIKFNDDTLNYNRKWLMQFLEIYEKEIKIPFIAVCRIDRLDEELVKKFKDAGVDKINFSIEQGNEEFRAKVLKRPMKNKDIIEGCRLLRKYNIRFYISNMIGLPGETLDLALETLKMNQIVKPTAAAAGIFMPYPGTEIHESMKEQGYLSKEYKLDSVASQLTWGTNNVTPTSYVVSDEINKLINLHSFFSFLVKHPKFLCIVKPLLNLPPNRYFEMFTNWYVFKTKYQYSATREESISYIWLLLRNIFPLSIRTKIEKMIGFQVVI